MNPDLKQRTINILQDFIDNGKWREDQIRDAMDEGSTGGYSDEIQEAVKLLEELTLL